MKYFLQTLLLLSLLATGLIHAQSPYDITSKELNEDYVENLYVQAAKHLDPDSVSTLLEKGIYISEKINYGTGVKFGYTELVNTYRKGGKVTKELRARLQWENYLSDKGFNASLAENYFEVGNLYFKNEIYSKAGEAFSKSLDLSEKHGFKTKYLALKNLAWARHREKNFPVAKELYTDAIALAEEKGNKEDELWLRQQLADIAHQRNRHQEEVKINQQILDLTREGSSPEARMKAMNNLGYAYKYLGELNKSTFYFKEVLKVIPKNSNNTMKAGILQNLGIIYQNRAMYDQAIEKFTEAIFIYRDEKDLASEATAKDFIALIYYQKDDPWNALQYNADAIDLSRKNELWDPLKGAYQTKSLIHQSLFEYEEALAAYMLHLSLKDSLSGSEKALRKDLNQTKDDLERMDNELRLRWISEDLKDAEIAQLTAEREAEAEKLVVLKKEAELKDAEARENGLKAKRALDQLIIARKEAEVAAKKREVDSEIEARKAAQREQELAERQQKIAEQKAEAEQQKAELSEQAALISQQQLDIQKTRTQNLILVLLGLGIFAAAILLILAQLRKEKKKSEQLLLNILPASVAEELKKNNKTTPRSYANTSIVFTDFSGFTQISEKLTPEELVHTLDGIFGNFDEIVEANGLTRIKTIGDAYMCACGLPEDDADHARKAVNAAIGMRDYIVKFNLNLPAGTPQWNIRIGVNSGQVVAGVVGIKKFAYDIWGDTVNLAARMESSGQIGKVNISEDTYKIVKDQFQTEPRGKVKAKNKGEIEMYFVEKA